MIASIQHAAENVGGITRLAREIGVKHQTFYSWKRVPAERVLDIERVSGVPRHELRPDLYPAPSMPTATPASNSNLTEALP
ncbi:MAG: hypothetical protein K0R27_290 [Xanthobacteraceae bacterium]|jgi:DNA-binding transcriptional regulator YdaS (Cro superfamily)|nr:hypothetical protein [Xanthobacteraceae bacterium]